MKVDSMFFFSLTWVMESPLRSPSKAERSLVPSLEFFDAKMQEKVLQKGCVALNGGTVEQLESRVVLNSRGSEESL